MISTVVSKERINNNNKKPRTGEELGEFVLRLVARHHAAGLAGGLELRPLVVVCRLL